MSVLQATQPEFLDPGLVSTLPPSAQTFSPTSH